MTNKFDFYVVEGYRVQVRSGSGALEIKERKRFVLITYQRPKIRRTNKRAVINVPEFCSRTSVVVRVGDITRVVIEVVVKYCYYQLFQSFYR